MFAATPAWSVTSVNLPLPSLRYRWLCGRILRLLLQRIRMHARFQRLAAGDVEIEQPIVVVVEPDAAAARAFQQRSQLLRAEAVRELDSGGRSRIFEPNRRRRGVASAPAAPHDKSENAEYRGPTTSGLLL